MKESSLYIRNNRNFKGAKMNLSRKNKKQRKGLKRNLHLSLIYILNFARGEVINVGKILVI